MKKINCNTRIIGRRIVNLTETDSTNLAVRNFTDSEDGHGSVVTAEYQTAGRGRRGRGWHSPAGTGIWMSLLLKPEIPVEKVSMLTLITALAAAQAIEDVTRVSVQIKWPNDLVGAGRKLCGILTELNMTGDQIKDVVIGMGINANMEYFPEEVAQTATSLRLLKGEEIDREAVAGRFLERFEEYYDIFCADLDLSRLKADYERRLVNKDRRVRILDPAGEYEATALGVGETGELLIRLADGSCREIGAGEVSVRGIYGYV
ncbi:biotin--[acetyl-CoA-carboxylase] ligase [Anaerolentibacter hominis]|uniref:biotin--[acetyl-CoA-carboxylase] ligase n=1 Tax=Anaerolentibacter hominis TaxID=3079009 RepID=UPI0031B7FF37